MTEAMQFREFVAGEIRDADDRERSFSHAISDESPDGHGSIIKVDGWDLKRFEKNPVVLFAHNSSDLPIGRSKRIWKEDGKLMSRTEFAGAEQNHDLAETAYRLVRDGFIRAWSVGFMPKERKLRDDLNDDEKKHFFDPYVYTKQELMEYSLVPVPSNPRALMAARSAGQNVDPLMDWFAQHQKITDFYCARGIQMPADKADNFLEEIHQIIIEESMEELVGR